VEAGCLNNGVGEGHCHGVGGAAHDVDCVVRYVDDMGRGHGYAKPHDVARDNPSAGRLNGGRRAVVCAQKVVVCSLP